MRFPFRAAAPEGFWAGVGRPAYTIPNSLRPCGPAYSSPSLPLWNYILLDDGKVYHSLPAMSKFASFLSQKYREGSRLPYREPSIKKEEKKRLPSLIASIPLYFPRFWTQSLRLPYGKTKVAHIANLPHT